MKTVLSLGGGGIKGRVLAQFLAGIEPNPDLIIGTSTGGILALARAAGKTFNQASKLYDIYGSTIFAKTGVRKILGRWTCAKYSNEGLKQVLISEFGDMTLKDVKIPVVVVCQWKATNQLSLIKSWANPNMTLVDAALCTSAAPTYFPSHLGRIDGGVSRNNPCGLAIVEALKLWKGDPFRLLSMACPRAVSGSDPVDGDWGALQWLTQGGIVSGFVNTFMDGGMDASVDEATEAMDALGFPFLHLEPEPDAIGTLAMDDPSPLALEKLDDIAARMIDKDLVRAKRFLS